MCRYIKYYGSASFSSRNLGKTRCSRFSPVTLTGTTISFSLSHIQDAFLRRHRPTKPTTNFTPLAMETTTPGRLGDSLLLPTASWPKKKNQCYRSSETRITARRIVTLTHEHGPQGYHSRIRPRSTAWQIFVTVLDDLLPSHLQIAPIQATKSFGNHQIVAGTQRSKRRQLQRYH